MLAVILALSLFATGCGGSEENSAGGGNTQTEQSSSGDGAQTDQNTSSEGSASGSGSLTSFSGKTTDGGTFTQDDLAGKDVTVINFWATWCGPCVSELPELAELEKELPDNVQLITVCIDGPDAAEDAERILSEAGFEGTALISTEGGLTDIINGIQYIPTTVVSDSSGTLLGDALIGSPENLTETYADMINSALQSLGKEPVDIG